MNGGWPFLAATVVEQSASDSPVSGPCPGGAMGAIHAPLGVEMWTMQAFGTFCCEQASKMVLLVYIIVQKPIQTINSINQRSNSHGVPAKTSQRHPCPATIADDTQLYLASLSVRLAPRNSYPDVIDSKRGCTREKIDFLALHLRSA